MKGLRALKHLCTGDFALRRAFAADSLTAIEQTVQACESQHAGEIRFAVEAALTPAALWRGQTARSRAIDVFSELHVWDTERNNGVLIYLLLADHDAEIVADRGIGADPAEWEACCQIMERHFRSRRFREGAIAGIEAVAAVLARHSPGAAAADNELPDTPAVL